MSDYQQHDPDPRRAEHAVDTPRPIELVAAIRGGRLTVTAADVTTTTVRVSGAQAEEVVVERMRGRDGISVVAPKPRGGLFGSGVALDIDVRVPTGSSLVVRSGSADVATAGELAVAKVKCGSGDVDIECLTGAAVVTSGSGRVRIGYVGGALKASSGSGSVEVGGAGSAAAISTGSGDVRVGRTAAILSVKTGSGDIEVGEAEDDVAMRTGSGSMVVRTARRGRISGRSGSGDVRLGIPDGTPVWTDITTGGRATSGLRPVGAPEPGADHVEIRVVTGSGDVVLAPA
ncbi:DUF4097 domain-containing protein [Nocardioides sp. GY 10113]|uniref:DUF4097 family beta strand repeat-containing protein n=1 Tax=Nocardioides sp. GY 10113 TaxID=2569761 RepID=UPI0010A80191|nr:DUF4097 family beta strand repeat-containing protein [Nocardioides sp. GY 10113]TIC84974.1 DUF4097 domain-containing protein [Nocardioides sp. GY 10113]